MSLFQGQAGGPKAPRAAGWRRLPTLAGREGHPGGAHWHDAIDKAVRTTDVVLVCLSAHSVNAEGYLQREIRLILEVADEKLRDTIFVIPLKLEKCPYPRELRELQWIDFFAANGVERLLESLALRAQQLGAAVPALGSATDAASPSVQGAYERATEAAELVLSRQPHRPEIGLVLGPGMRAFGERLDESWAIDLGEIPHFPLPPRRMLLGRLAVGKLGGVPVAAMVGRPHAYEGLRLDEVIFPMRMFFRMGIQTVIFSAAVTGLNTALGVGTLVVSADHINELGANPLSGANDERFGPRFPDLTEVYSRRLRAIAVEAAAELGFQLPEAVFLVRPGPTYETPAEARAMRNLGADVVGMSTVPEAIAARQMGMQVLAISVVTNSVAGAPLAHSDVEITAERSKNNFEALLTSVIPKIAEAGRS